MDQLLCFLLVLIRLTKKKDFRYRFRVINSGTQYCPLRVSVDNHNLTIIATDGNPVQPVKVTSFYILTGKICV